MQSNFDVKESQRLYKPFDGSPKSHQQGFLNHPQTTHKKMPHPSYTPSIQPAQAQTVYVPSYAAAGSGITATTFHDSSQMVATRNLQVTPTPYGPQSPVKPYSPYKVSNEDALGSPKHPGYAQQVQTYTLPVQTAKKTSWTPQPAVTQQPTNKLTERWQQKPGHHILGVPKPMQPVGRNSWATPASVPVKNAPPQKNCCSTACWPKSVPTTVSPTTYRVAAEDSHYAALSPKYVNMAKSAQAITSRPVVTQTADYIPNEPFPTYRPMTTIPYEGSITPVAPSTQVTSPKIIQRGAFQATSSDDLQNVGRAPSVIATGRSPIKWGICGTGRMCRDFTNVLLSRSSEVDVVAVGASTLKKAKKFAQRFNIPKAYGTYQELADDPDVEVVYIGTVNIFHYAHTMLMLECAHPKHILCEKPLGVTYNEVETMILSALKVNRILLEGFSTRFFPCYKEARRCIADGEIGQVTAVAIDFGMVAPPDFHRVFEKDLGGGALLDVGCYAVQYATMVYDGARPDEVKACGLLSAEKGVDLTGAATLHWRGRGVAQIVYGLQGWYCNECRIVGDVGLIRIRDSLHTPTSFHIRKYQDRGDYSEETITWNIPEISGGPQLHYPKSECLVYEIAEMNRMIIAGELESPEYTYTEMLNVAIVMEEIRIQLGIAEIK